MAALQEAKNRVASPFTVHAKTWSNRKDYRDLILLHCISMSLCGSSCKKEKKKKKKKNFLTHPPQHFSQKDGGDNFIIIGLVLN
jgi:hypothetical protein